MRQKQLVRFRLGDIEYEDRTIALFCSFPPTNGHRSASALWQKVGTVLAHVIVYLSRPVTSNTIRMIRIIPPIPRPPVGP